jgi:hypothetical protein
MKRSFILNPFQGGKRMRSFPKELFSRIPAKAINHAGMYALLCGNSTLHFGFTGPDETIKSCVERALEGELIVTNPITNADTVIDSDLITHVGFIVSKPLRKQGSQRSVCKTTGQNRLSSTKVTKNLYWRETDSKHRSN